MQGCHFCGDKAHNYVQGIWAKQLFDLGLPVFRSSYSLSFFTPAFLSALCGPLDGLPRWWGFLLQGLPSVSWGSWQALLLFQHFFCSYFLLSSTSHPCWAQHWLLAMQCPASHFLLKEAGGRRRLPSMHPHLASQAHHDQSCLHISSVFWESLPLLLSPQVSHHHDQSVTLSFWAL